MINLGNPHWSANAQLDRRRGGNGYNRMPPDAVGGYVMALRHPNAKFQIGNSAHRGRSNAPLGETDLEPRISAAVGRVPADFRNADFADLEKGLSKVVNSTDD